jgi:hypothetical protein
MNQRIKSLMDRAEYQTKKQSGYEDWEVYVPPDSQVVLEKFAQLLVSDVLREVDTRAYVSGDRAWSDDLDRPWIELEYGFGTLADAQRQARKIK